MSKDPAFLFYSKDFYEGTRTMLPEERACYIDLLIYQHQNGIIPLDLRRVLMYCNGISQATLEATLEAKFKRNENGWYNKKLSVVNSDRKDYSEKQSVNGSVGQFWKKTKAILSDTDYLKLRKLFLNKNTNEVYEIVKNIEINIHTLQGLFKHLVIVNESVNVIEVKNKDEVVIKEKIDFKKIVDVFNFVCISLPKVEKITEARKKSIRRIIDENSFETLGIVFQKVSESGFLNGDSSTGWKADFDWILKPNNFVKILEGNYINKSNGGTKSNEQIFTEAITSQTGSNFSFK